MGIKRTNVLRTMDLFRQVDGRKFAGATAFVR